MHRCFHVSTYKACYEPVIAHINGQNMWRPSGVQPVQPPIEKRPLGRPKKKMTREAGEQQVGELVSLNSVGPVVK